MAITRKYKVGLVQMSMGPDPEANFAAAIEHIHEAARRGALDIVGWRGLGTDGGGQEAVLRSVAVIADGAKWIWEHVATTFGSERVEILDWYHCCQHLWVVGDALHGAGTPHAAAWVAQAKEVIWRRSPDDLLRLLASCR